jgi:hypothetical protein
MSAAVSAGDAAAQLRDLAQDVEMHGWAEYTREHVANILKAAAEELELGLPLIDAGGLATDPGRHIPHPSQRSHLKVVEP